MNPPEVEVMTTDDLIKVIEENVDLIIEMYEKITRELVEEELEVLERLGKFLEQWREDVGGYFVEYE